MCVASVVCWTTPLVSWLVQPSCLFLERVWIPEFLTSFLSPLLEALSFQGRLKYLHGQNGSRDNGTCSHPQLALFSIAVPVHPPPIVEIRAKMLLFQSKHKLDFTPMGIDSR